MRVGGLFLALLIGIGLYLYLSADSAQKVTKVSQPARDAAVEISGQGMKESFGVETVEKDGKVTGLLLKGLNPQGALASMYDVKLGDVIVGVGPFSIKDTDAEMLYAQLLEAGARQHKLTILRNGQRLELENHGAAAILGGKEDKGRMPGGNLNPLGVGTH